jgi:peptidoglycan/LPS O-acetylase OafA/YrhL
VARVLATPTVPRAARRPGHEPPAAAPAQRLAHEPALDGVRGVAVAVVLLFHHGASWTPGGFLGVSLFFTLSGYLITSLLLAEHDATGRVSLRRFWARRARRLMPAALVTIAGALVLTAVTAPDRLVTVAGDARAAVAYVANWQLVVADRSYATLFDAPSALQHLWSLAIEEQFYLLFPPVAVAALRWRGRRGLTAVVAATAALSVAAQVLTANADLAYYGTHTRAAELLAGCLLACLRPLPTRAGAVRTHAHRVDDAARATGTGGPPADTRAAPIGGRVVLAKAGEVAGPTGAGAAPVDARARPTDGAGAVGATSDAAEVTLAASRSTGRTRGDPRRRGHRLTGGDPAGMLADAAGLAGLGAFAVAVVRVSDSTGALAHGGLAVMAVVNTAVVVGAVSGRGVGVVLRWAPLRRLGVISYGVYLFHWPLFTVLTPARLRLSGPALFAVRAGATVALAALSARYVERPVRAGRWPSARRLVPTMGGAAAGVLLAATVAPVLVPDGAATDDWQQLATAGPGARPPEPPLAGGAGPRPSGTGPARVAVVGDSTAIPVGRALTAWADGTRRAAVLDLSRNACSIIAEESRFAGEGTLVLPVCPLEEAWRALTAFDPDTVLMTESVMEVAAHRTVGARPGPWRSLGDPDVDRALTAAVHDAVALLHRLAPRATLAWANGPYIEADSCPSGCPSTEPARMDRYNQLVAEALAGHPEVRPVDLAGRLNPAGGTGVDRSVRPDGIHLAPGPARALVERWLGPLLAGAPAPDAPAAGG